MKNLELAAHLKTTTVRQFLFISLLGLLVFSTAQAQESSTNPTDGFTPAGLQAGSPTGSFPLSGFDTINPYNGDLTFSLPLLKAIGRGSAGYTVQQNLSAKWTVTYNRVDNGTGGYYDFFEPALNAGPQARWYSAGAMVGRVAQDDINSWNCYWSYDPVWLPGKTLTRYTFIGPDGTSYEFRDQLLQGAPATVPMCATTSANRGSIFTTTDGTSATFISDGDIYDSILVQGSPQGAPADGYIKWRDGTVYRIDGGWVSWIRDRNGNKLTFSNGWYQTVITDSLNRQIIIDYDFNDPTYGLCNRIRYKGFGGAQRTIWITLGNMSTALRSGSSIQTIHALFPELRGSSTYSFNPQVVTGIYLPNGKQYKFYYNSYMEVARVELPTGGAYEYDWGAGLVGGAASGASCFSCFPTEIYRRVLERRIYPTGGTGSSYDRKITFSRPESIGNGGPAPNDGYVFVNQYNSSGTLLTSEKHYYFGGAFASMGAGPTDYSPWAEGKEYQTDVFASNGTTLLRQNNTSWGQRFHVGWWSGSGDAEPSCDPIVVATTNTLADTNQVSQTTFSYDQFNNQTDVIEYDYGAGGPGTVLRQTHSTYMTTNPVNGLDYTANSIHIRNLPSQRSVYGGGLERARVAFEYDNHITDSNHAGLVSRSNISGLDSTFNSANTTRGNTTSITSYLLTAGSVTGSVTTYSQYDIAGSLVKNIDGRGYATIFEYDDRYGTPDGEATTNPGPTDLGGLSSYAFATRVNRQGQITTTQVDYYLGRPVDARDANGFVTSGIYNDSLDRLTQVNRAVGTAAASRTLYTYDDTGRVITTLSDLTTLNDGVLTTKGFYDQLGRTIETRQYEGGTNYITKQIQYDALGRPYKSSNPYRLWQGESPVWTTQAFDSLGRVTSVTTPDNAVVSKSYLGNAVTVTDQAGKVRKSVSDALGRLVQVYEDPASFNYLTTYGYDVLDDVTTVTQGSQTRTFVYDSFKRLKSATSPETGAITYNYDNNGNMISELDARGVETTYVYDGLNRNTNVNYSDATPDIVRQYDAAINGIGRLSATLQSGTDTSATYIDSYDALGRPLIQRQRYETSGVWSDSYQTQRAYNLDGHVTSQIYPSGHTVTYTYDAAGRAYTFTGTLGDGSNRTYANTLEYSPFGGLTREQFGTTTPLYHKSFYNIRGQFFDTRLSSVNDLWDWNRGRLIFYYSGNHIWGQSGTDNNGNVRFAETWIPPENATLDQADVLMTDTYIYDSLNRLSNVYEDRMSVSTGWGTWFSQFRQAYNYDRFGNRTIDAGLTWGTGINNRQFSVDTNTNRLGVPSGQSGTMTYDLAGNLITDSYSGAGARTYDAENRMITSADYTGQTSRYTYDAEGRRVRRQVASSQEEWQIFGFDGELLAEYRASTAASAPEKEYGYRNGELLVTATGRYNVALASNGATASASSAHTCCGFSTWGAINGNNRGPWGNGEGWNDATQGVVPDWIQVDFAGSKTIDEVSVFSLHDNYTAANTPTETQTFSLYGLLGFDVQYWNGSSWVTIPNGSVTGNNKVWRKFTFSAVTTSKIRVYINTVPDSWSRVVEIQAFGTSAGGEKVQWLVADHLGTPRMIVDQTGTLASVRRHDYLPFGEELFAGIGGRTVSSGYSADGVRQQFIAKERDVETGLDYFGARYYASVQGRFTSADPITMTVGRLMDPQRLNLYSHCRNNPEKFIDSSGEDLLLANQVAHERARANIDARLRPEERKNIDIVGDKVVLKDPAAINVSTSTNAYRGLAAVIQNHNAIVNYYGLKPGDTVQLRLPAATTEGPVLNQLTYQDVHDRGGVTIPYVTEGSTVIIYDVYVTTATDLHVLGTDNVTLVSMPEEIVFYHEVAGHAGGLDLPQTIAFENAVRQDTGVPNLPPRSGLDHTGQVVVASPDLIQVPPPTVPKNYLIIRPLKKREEIP